MGCVCRRRPHAAGAAYVGGARPRSGEEGRADLFAEPGSWAKWATFFGERADVVWGCVEEAAQLTFKNLYPVYV